MFRLQLWKTTLVRFLAQAKKGLTVTGLVLCIAFLGWSLPAQAANRITPQLEEEVLQIILNHPEVILESLQAYQQQQQQQQEQARQTFLQDIKTNPKAFIGESPTNGAAESKIVLIEFSDFQCPYCAKADRTLKQFMAKHQNEVTLVYKHFPLTSIHPQALSAAKAAWAANQQGKFWQYHDALFTQQDKLGEELYLEIAQSLNLDLEQFNRDRNVADTAIKQDMQLAEKLGVTGTPFFVMNEEIFSGAMQLSNMEKVLASVSKSQIEKSAEVTQENSQQ
jgi:protein-disulfide isomerase